MWLGGAVLGLWLPLCALFYFPLWLLYSIRTGFLEVLWNKAGLCLPLRVFVFALLSAWGMCFLWLAPLLAVPYLFCLKAPSRRVLSHPFYWTLRPLPPSDALYSSRLLLCLIIYFFVYCFPSLEWKLCELACFVYKPRTMSVIALACSKYLGVKWANEWMGSRLNLGKEKEILPSETGRDKWILAEGWGRCPQFCGIRSQGWVLRGDGECGAKETPEGLG